MKSLFVLLGLSLSSMYLFSQTNISNSPRMFVSSGFVSPQFFSGIELSRAYQLRQQGLSYFEAEDGAHRAVGDYAANTGFSISIGYFVPLKQVRGLSVGALVNSGQTGSTPSEAGYAEGYFFNFLNVALAAQYYPFPTNNLYVKAEAGMGSVFTKNRFINEAGEQDFLHHFGIGIEGGAGIGYTLTPFANKGLGLFVEAAYQLFQTSVEVSGIGDDAWRFGALHLSTGVSF